MKKLELDAINLTSECLRRFWQKDSSLVLSFLAEDILWIGAQDAEFLLGFEQTRDDLLAAEKEIPPCILLNAEFQAVSIGSKTCIVTGKYLTTTDKTTDFFLQGVQRCTFVWEKYPDGMRIHHIHVSNPLGELQLTGEERFPTTMGKLAHHYMQKQIKRLTESRKISVPGEKGMLHTLMLSEILYISAFSKDSIITTSSSEILVKKSISQLQQLLGKDFISVHRSYLVNPDYVASIERYTVTVVNGERIPIPQKKYNEIRNLLLHFYNVDGSTDNNV